MKKLYKYLLCSVFFALLFSSCYDNVFMAIRKEVKLEDSEVSGFINDIVRFRSDHTFTEKTTAEDGTVTETIKTQNDEFLYLPTGIIYYKQISNNTENSTEILDLTYNDSHGTWSKGQSGISGLGYNYYGEGFDGEYIVKLASNYNSDKNSSTLYALTVLWEKYDDKGRNVPYRFKLYTLNNVDDSWSFVGENSPITKTFDNYFKTGKKDNYGTDLRYQLFCTNTPKVENRRTFMRVGTYGLWFTAYDKSGNEIGEVESVVYELKNGAIDSVIYYSKREKDSSGNYTYSVGGDEASNCYNETISNKSESAVDLGGQVVFLPNIAATSNATKTSDATWICYASGTKAYYFTKSDFDSASTVQAKKIKNNEEVSETFSVNQMIAYWSGLHDSAGKSIERPDSLKEVEGLNTDKSIISASASKDDILFGTKGKGVYRATISEDGNSITKSSGFDGLNTGDIMTSPYIIPVLFTVDPSLGGKEATRYSAMDFLYTETNSGANDSHRGLWSYYKSRGNWNRE